ncbi:MAG: hypothetical protein RLZZ234_473 [Candidatus Parcubacteria bacterium]|jgi:A/G-specific adenine glycosylase
MTPNKFRKIVYAYYKAHGRHDLPWRQTIDPYAILVSEIMLQQTQVDRVLPFYTRFLERFPDVQALHKAPLGDVFRVWQGLGYNRRAKLLHECAHVLVREHRGIFPQTTSELQALPGIGPYTAHAIVAFAFNQEAVMIETNIRTVFIYHFFRTTAGVVSDHELLPLIARMQDTTHPRAWYSALMDYGTHLKKSVGNISRRSAHHVTQKPFKGSDREVRGAIMRALADESYSRASLVRVVGHPALRVHAQLQKLRQEGMVISEGRKYRLP